MGSRIKSQVLNVLRRYIAELKRRPSWPSDWRTSACQTVWTLLRIPAGTVNRVISMLTPDEWDSLELPEPAASIRPTSAIRPGGQSEVVGKNPEDSDATTGDAPPPAKPKPKDPGSGSVDAPKREAPKIPFPRTELEIPPYRLGVKPIPRIPALPPKVVITDQSEVRGGTISTRSNRSDAIEHVFGKSRT